MFSDLFVIVLAHVMIHVYGAVKETEELIKFAEEKKMSKVRPPSVLEHESWRGGGGDGLARESDRKEEN